MEYAFFKYEEDINDPESFVYKVGVCVAIDANKSDWAFIALGSQRTKTSNPKLHGLISFKNGENDDPGAIIRRAVICLERSDLLFDNVMP